MGHFALVRCKASSPWMGLHGKLDGGDWSSVGKVNWPSLGNKICKRIHHLIYFQKWPNHNIFTCLYCDKSNCFVHSFFTHSHCKKVHCGMSITESSHVSKRNKEGLVRLKESILTATISEIIHLYTLVICLFIRKKLIVNFINNILILWKSHILKIMFYNF